VGVKITLYFMSFTSIYVFTKYTVALGCPTSLCVHHNTFGTVTAYEE